MTHLNQNTFLNSNVHSAHSLIFNWSNSTLTGLKVSIVFHIICHDRLFIPVISMRYNTSQPAAINIVWGEACVYLCCQKKTQRHFIGQNKKCLMYYSAPWSDTVFDAAGRLNYLLLDTKKMWAPAQVHLGHRCIRSALSIGRCPELRCFSWYQERKSQISETLLVLCYIYTLNPLYSLETSPELEWKRLKCWLSSMGVPLVLVITSHILFIVVVVLKAVAATRI